MSPVWKAFICGWILGEVSFVFAFALCLAAKEKRETKLSTKQIAERIEKNGII